MVTHGRRHNPLIPASDGMRIIFPYRRYDYEYNTGFFVPAIVDNRVTGIEIENFMNQIYQATNNFSVHKKIQYLQIFGILCFSALWVVGGYLIYQVEKQNMNTNPNLTPQKGQSETNDNIFPIAGILVIFLSLIGFCIYIYYMVSYTRSQVKIIYSKIVNIISINQAQFQNVGLRWVVPENIRWLELWMDFRFNQQNPALPLYSQTGNNSILYSGAGNFNQNPSLYLQAGNFNHAPPLYSQAGNTNIPYSQVGNNSISYSQVPKTDIL